MKNILITGGLGYCGIMLSTQLADLGHKVIIVDIDMYDSGRLIKNKCENIIVLKEDIRNVYWDELLIKYNINVIYHLAMISNDPGYGMSKAIGREININSAKTLYLAATRNNVELFVYPSSCSVYGVSHVKVNEKSVVNPLSEYAKAKCDVEDFIQKNKIEAMRTIIFRPATVFGFSLRQRYDLIVNKILVNTISEKNATIPNTNNIRPCISMEFLIRSYIAALDIQEVFVIINLVSFNENIQYYIKKIEGIFGKQLSYSIKENDHRSYSVSNEKAIKYNLLENKKFDELVMQTYQNILRYKYVDYDDNIFYNEKIQPLFFTRTK